MIVPARNRDPFGCAAKPPAARGPVLPVRALAVVLSLAAALAGGLIACGGREGAPAQRTSGKAGGDTGDARLQSALALLRDGQVAAGLDELRRATSTSGATSGAGSASATGPRGARSPSWLPEVVQMLVDRRWLAQADSLLQAYPGALETNADLTILAAQLAKTAGRLEEAAGRYRAALRDASAAPDAQTELARLELDRGRFAEAADAAREALRLQPERTEARLTLVQALLKAGGTPEALEQARRMPAGAARARFLGAAHLALGRPDSAAVWLRRAHEAQPDADAAGLLLGRAELAVGNAAEASRVIRPLAARPEPFEDAQLHLETALRELGRTAAADSVRRAYGATLRRREAVALRVEGLQKTAGGDLAGALHAFERARELDPQLLDLANDVGAVLARLGRFEEAQQELQHAARLQPESAAVQRNLANLYQLTGDTLRRDQALRRFADLTKPKEPEEATRASRTPR